MIINLADLKNLFGKTTLNQVSLKVLDVNLLKEILN